jgi:adenylate cyclase
VIPAVGFTEKSSDLEPHQLVSRVNSLFSSLRRACEATEVEKIKSIGDAYMAVGGLPGTRADHIGAIAELAIGMVSSVRDVEPADGRPWRTGSGSTPDPQ